MLVPANALVTILKVLLSGYLAVLCSTPHIDTLHRHLSLSLSSQYLEKQVGRRENLKGDYPRLKFAMFAGQRYMKKTSSWTEVLGTCHNSTNFIQA